MKISKFKHEQNFNTEFLNPPAKYRSMPFWCWNNKLNEKELIEQIDILKEMGFGGFYPHSRAGLDTEYLSKEFMSLIVSCNKKAKEEGLYSNIYDEDRWPSGTCGGRITKNKKFRSKFLWVLDENSLNLLDGKGVPNDWGCSHDKGCKPKLITCFDIELDNDGYLISYKKIKENEKAKGLKVYAYICTRWNEGFFNDFSYLDAMNKKAVNKFISSTYNKYFKYLDKEFGKSILTVFTDEPQIKFRNVPNSSFNKIDYIGPWCFDFDKFFKQEYDLNFFDNIPLLIWNDKNDTFSKYRYAYQNLCCDIFCNTYMKLVHNWTSTHNIDLTGHLAYEDSLVENVFSYGEVMRCYKYFDMPGIDVLFGNVSTTSLKQCQSIVHQYNKKGMLSELFGGAGYKSDFIDYKRQADLQIALGATNFVPHLSWVSMKGCAKRDFPTTFNYQSPWYKEFAYLENHFARIHYCLDGGKPIVHIAVLHPIESAWLYYASKDINNKILDELENSFQDITNGLLNNNLDFDFLSESLIPELISSSKEGLSIGNMNYTTVVIPYIKTIRKSTVDILCDFINKGGKIISLIDTLHFVDGVKSEYANKLFDNVTIVNSISELFDTLEYEREIRIISDKRSNDYVYNYKYNDDARWLFIARNVNYICKNDDTKSNLKIHIKGSYKPLLYNTLNGEILDLPFEINGGITTIYLEAYDTDSFLIKLNELANCNVKYEQPEKKDYDRNDIYVDKHINYSLSEPNVCVLDKAAFSFDNVHYSDTEELLKIDKKIRIKNNWPTSSGEDIQPWAIKGRITEKAVYLRFELESKVEQFVKFAFEEADEIILNGKKVDICIDGYFVDKNIYTTKLPNLKIGKNTLILKTKISKKTSLENCFILGEFGVEIVNGKPIIIEKPSTICLGSIKDQGFPFYGGNVNYFFNVELSSQNLIVKTNNYKGSLASVAVDEINKGFIIGSPYELKIDNLTSGKHTIKITLFGNRNNCFGALHNCNGNALVNPIMWYTEKEDWTYDYVLSDLGVNNLELCSKTNESN